MSRTNDAFSCYPPPKSTLCYFTIFGDISLSIHTSLSPDYFRGTIIIEAQTKRILREVADMIVLKILAAPFVVALTLLVDIVSFFYCVAFALCHIGCVVLSCRSLSSSSVASHWAVWCSLCWRSLFCLWLSWPSPDGSWKSSARRNTPRRNSSQVDKLNTLRYGPPQERKRYARLSSISREDFASE